MLGSRCALSLILQRTISRRCWRWLEPQMGQMVWADGAGGTQEEEDERRAARFGGMRA